MTNTSFNGSEISYRNASANLQDQTVTIGNTTFQRADTEEAITPYWLEPIGDTGLYITPGEPADPTDCDRYPNSPWCGGDLANWDDIASLSPISNEGNVQFGQDEVCATLTTTVFGIGLPPVTVCYRGDNAPPIQPPPVPEHPEIAPQTAEDLQFIPLEGYASRNTACSYVVKWRFWGSVWRDRPVWTGNTEAVLNVIQESGANLVLGMLVWRLPTPNDPPGCGAWHMAIVQESPSGEILYIGSYTTYSGYYWQNYNPTPLPPPFIVSVEPVGYCPPRPQPPIRTLPPYPEEPDMCNCNEMTQLLRLIALRLGVNEYPVQVPVNVADESNSHEDHQSLTTLLGWVFKQMDALTGQYPIKVKVKDIDPTEEGDQEKEVSIPNAGEALAELYGMQLRSSVNSDVLIEMLLRMSSEIMQIKNAAIVTQDYSKANAEFLGYKGKTVNRKVQSAFDVSQLADLAKFLKESEKQVVSWKCDDDDSLVEYLRKLMFSAGIIKAVFWRSKDDAEKLINSFRQYIDPDSDYNQERDNKFDEWIAELNREDSQFNLNAPVFPKLDKLASSEESE